MDSQFLQVAQVPNQNLWWWKCQLCGTTTASESAPSNHVCSNPNGCSLPVPSKEYYSVITTGSETEPSTFDVVGKNGIALLTKYPDKKGAEGIADILNIAFEEGRHQEFFKSVSGNDDN